MKPGTNNIYKWLNMKLVLRNKELSKFSYTFLSTAVLYIVILAISAKNKLKTEEHRHNLTNIKLINISKLKKYFQTFRTLCIS